ncbi:MAG: DUF2798 domain-containing protein [Pseudomonadota bacterium]
MLPKRLAPYLLAFLLSGVMSFLVSGISTYRAIGAPDGFFGTWMSAWSLAWAVAFPTLVVFRPVITRLVARVTAD